MKIAIIGGGWLGCHLAMKLKGAHDITIYEKNTGLFEESSYKNQNRLHQGYHYARSNKTRTLCKDTFDRFTSDYSFIISNVANNLYCIPDESLIDFETVKKIYHGYGYKEVVNNSFSSLQGIIRVDEKHIDFIKAHSFFNKLLSPYIHRKCIDEDSIKKISGDNDLVINCTNNFIKNPECPTAYYELTCTFLYEKLQPVNFGAVTLIDGNFFSIYPYTKNLYTVTDVEYTPVQTFSNPSEISSFNLPQQKLKERLVKVESRVLQYYPNFLRDFAYSNYFLSIKSKYMNSSADRYPVINKVDNVVNVFTGKIQGIYVVEDYINEIISR